MQGRMWSSSTVGKSFKAVRDRCGIESEVTWHSLRHFYASALIHSGASVKTVQERLGHESAETRLQVCAHLWPGEDERTRKAVDSALMRDQCGTDREVEASEYESAPAARVAAGADSSAELVPAQSI
ncbi:tyrosine-type recombinase/integrase [Rhodococcus sp. NPDC059234]|uniref:tyrosine-type recombinase/integrase n=1 Tax=Rhodococcus sp. NPDC059234 TaxID=3346781 RepID=UPI00366EA1DD